MSRIDIENAKTLRPAMTVICGMDVLEMEISAVTTQGYYDDYAGAVDVLRKPDPLMDLSGDGFPNNGEHLPLPETHDGIFASINTQLIIDIRTVETIDDGIPVTIYGYKGDELTKWTFETTGGGTIEQFTIPPSDERIFISKVLLGKAWWFDNSSLISCNVNLRGVETTVDNPSLQMSEIEIKGYEPENIIGNISKFSDDYPIYYYAGYFGDMSEIRKFYLSDALEWDKNVLTIKGTDATRFLDGEFSGKYISAASGMTGIVSEYSTMLTNSGVAHSFINETGGDQWAQSCDDAVFIPKGTKRDLLAQATNLFKFDYTNVGGAPTLQFNYIDAGIPALKAKHDKNSTIKPIDNISDLKAVSERQIRRITLNNPSVDVAASAQIRTETFTGGSTVVEESDPYYSFSTSAGTLTTLSPYKYRIKRTGAATISGRKLTFQDPDLSSGSTTTPRVVSVNSSGRDVELSEFLGLTQMGTDQQLVYDVILHRLGDMANTSDIMYEFTFRGDPRLQPRDYISIEIDNVATQMTIESIDLNHEDGGLTSKIVARKGLI